MLEQCYLNVTTKLEHVLSWHSTVVWLVAYSAFSHISIFASVLLDGVFSSA